MTATIMNERFSFLFLSQMSEDTFSLLSSSSISEETLHAADDEKGEDSIAKTQSYWENKSGQLLGDQERQFKLMIQSLGRVAMIRIQQMKSSGYSAEKIQLEIKRSKTMMNAAGVQFFQGARSYEEKKKLGSRKIEQVSDEIRKTGPSFSDFSPPSIVRDAVEGYVSGRIENRFGANAARTFDFGAGILHADVEGSKSPIRDRVISAGVDTGIAETIAFFSPASVPTFGIMLGAKASGSLGEALEKPAQERLFRAIDDAISDQPKDPWERAVCNVVHSHTIQNSAESLAGVYFMRAPQALIDAVSKMGNFTLRWVGDQLGLTDEQINYAARRTFEYIAENSPDLMEEKAWAMSISKMRGEK